MKQKLTDIEQEIKANRFTITQLADILQISRTTLYEWLKGENPNHIELIRGAMKRSQMGNNNHYEANDRIVRVLELTVKSLANDNDSLNKRLDKQDVIIENQQQSLLEKNKIISNLEKELMECRKRIGAKDG